LGGGGRLNRFGDINIGAVVRESNYLISKAPRHGGIIIPLCADKMPLNIMAITAVFNEREGSVVNQHN